MCRRCPRQCEGARNAGAVNPAALCAFVGMAHRRYSPQDLPESPASRAVFEGLLRMPPGGLTVDIHRSWAPNDACRRSDHVRRRRQWKPSGARKGAPEPCDLGRRYGAGVTRPASATAARPAPRDARETPLAVGRTAQEYVPGLGREERPINALLFYGKIAI